MSHARQQIRDAVATLLNAAPSSYRRAYNTRIQPMQQVWPYLLVWIGTESVTLETIHPGVLLNRVAILTVEARLQVLQRETETMESRMDEIAAEIETTLTVSALQAIVDVKDISLADSSFDVVMNDEDGSISFALLTMNFAVNYYTVDGSPEILV